MNGGNVYHKVRELVRVSVGSFLCPVEICECSGGQGDVEEKEEETSREVRPQGEGGVDQPVAGAGGGT